MNWSVWPASAWMPPEAQRPWPEGGEVGVSAGQEMLLLAGGVACRECGLGRTCTPLSLCLMVSDW